jgi:hypothetical protein
MSQNVSEETRAVVLVGHCGPDAWMLKSMVGKAAPGRPIEMANSDRDLEAYLDSAALLLVNRVLDGRFGTESGIELIGSLASREGGAPPMILVSNLPDAQAEGERAGARPGFGKSDLYAAETIERVQRAIAGD